MTIEQKARAYDEALEAMSDIIPDENGLVHIRPSNIFHELKESEDERIRKALITSVSGILNGHKLYNTDVTREEALAWLEKQGEKSDYNPYKETVKSISIMVEKYAQPGSDLQDFYDNVKVKCKDAMEYEKTWLEKQGKPKSNWTDEDEELLQHCCGAVAAADYYTLEDKEEMENWLKSLKQRNL